MNKPDKLFQLIRSLQPSEKRYFKLHAARHTEHTDSHHAIKLFTALAEWKEPEYTDLLLRKKHRGKTFLKDLPTHKKRLHQLVLKVMRSYNTGRDPHIVLSEMLIDIRFLVSKGLREQAYELITEALHIANNGQMFAEVLILNDQLLQLYPVSPAVAPYTAQSVQEAESQTIQHINLTRQAAHLKVKLFEIEASGNWSKRQKEVAAVVKQVRALLPRCAHLRQAELYLINALQLYLLLEHKYSECLQLSQTWFDKVKETNGWSNYTSRQIRVSIGNHLHAAFKCENFESFPQTINQLKELRVESKTDEVEIFRLTTQYELLYFLNTHHFENCTPLLKAIDDGLKHYHAHISEKQHVYFRYNLALLEFFRKRYNASLKHLRQLFTDAGRNAKYSYIMMLARSLEWLCETINGNYEVLDNKLRNLNNCITAHYPQVQFLKTMAQFFQVIEKEKSYSSAKVTAAKKQLDKAECPPEWEQLKGIIIELL